ncbi:MAG: hypothetical protein HYS07_08630 [Chlamydiae bacterium]|nr:hypothetical protein [Chlamydiota bacterium]MBI3277862.1 hypothetical protein [Chlamydiota bacterium]
MAYALLTSVGEGRGGERRGKMKAYVISTMFAFMLTFSQLSMAQQETGQDFLSLLKSELGNNDKAISTDIKMNRDMGRSNKPQFDRKFVFSTQDLKRRA